MLLFIDFETYYDREYSLKKMTVPEYVYDRRFEAIGVAVAVGTAPSNFIVGHRNILEFFHTLAWDEAVTIAHNALFDNFILYHKFGHIPRLMLDTLGMARALRGHELERFSLHAVAEHLRVGQKGDFIAQMVGKHWGDLSSVEQREFTRYANNDIDLCRGIYKELIQELPMNERRLMDLVLRCAIQPKFECNVDLLKKRLLKIEAEKAELLARCGHTDPTELMSTPKFKKALEACGVPVEHKVSLTGHTTPAFAKTDKFMQDLLEHPDVRVQALAAARLGHKSTIEETRTQKFIRVAEAMPNRFPVPLGYGGPHTHRLAGEWGMNMQNLPSRRTIKDSELRNSLMAPWVSSGNQHVVVADLGQIEARLVAWLSKCEPLLTQFREKKDPYAILATKIFGREINRKKDIPEGFIGKTGILGLGYGCGVTKFDNMVQQLARQMQIDLTAINYSQTLAGKAVTTYRNTYREIPATWRQLDYFLGTTFVGNGKVIRFGPTIIHCGRVELPNGLYLNYENPRVSGGGVLYDYGRETGLSLWGGKFLENIVQALARVIVMDAALRIYTAGYRFVLQAHDELVYVIPGHELAKAKKIIHTEMTRSPAWAPDLPLTADVGVGATYGEAK